MNASTDQQADAIERALLKRYADWLIDDRDVPEMIVKGSTKKLRLKALMPNQTEEDALRRVTLELTRAGLDTRKADKLVSALMVFSRKQAGWDGDGDGKGKSRSQKRMSAGGEEMDEVLLSSLNMFSLQYFYIDMLTDAFSVLCSSNIHC